MSDRFNRNDANVPDDRLFADDFIVDQNGQDAELLQLAKDFGCLPCIGSGLGVTSLSEADHKVQIAAGWAYDKDGKRITVESAQEAVLVDTSGNTNYIVIAHAYTTDTPRNAHRTGTEYQTRKHDSFTITVTTSTPGTDEIILATATQTGTGPIAVSEEDRLARSCKLLAQSMLPEIAEEEGTGTGAPPGGPPPGTKPELPDYPKGRKVPMPIILSGTRNGSAWGGVETILPEELGRTTNAQAAITLERVNLKSGTPLADVKLWIGDWGTGQQDGTNPKKCNFTMPTESGVSAWDTDLWISNDAEYYYLVKSDESWFSKITDSGDSWVVCADDLPDADSHTFYVCPYAELYRSQAVPYKTDAELNLAHPQTVRHYNRIASPTAPVLICKDLNLGGKYKLKAASVISGDNYTKWTETDFVIGSDILVCWEPSSGNLNVTPVDGGVEVVIPAPGGGTEDPEAYELCYTYGTDAAPEPPEPDFTNSEHPTIRPKERKVKIDAPPGRKVRVKCRAIKYRAVMRCTDGDKELKPVETYILAGGVGLRRNRKQFTGMIDETDIPYDPPEDAIVIADEMPLPNPIEVERIYLFNPEPTGSTPQTEFEVYIHGSNQDCTAGEKIEISASGDYPSINPKASVEKTFETLRITDPAMKITVKNLDSATNSVNLRYGIQYKEDADV